MCLHSDFFGGWMGSLESREINQVTSIASFQPQPLCDPLMLGQNEDKHHSLFSNVISCLYNICVDTLYVTCVMKNLLASSLKTHLKTEQLC